MSEPIFLAAAKTGDEHLRRSPVATAGRRSARRSVATGRSTSREALFDTATG
jgi:hypothetical protein